MSTLPYPENEPDTRPSFREKSAWAGLLTTLAIYIPYFVFVSGQITPSTSTAITTLGAFIVAVVMQTASMVVAHIIFALYRVPERKDERDCAVEARAFHYAYIAFGGGAWTAAGLTLAWAGEQSGQPGDNHVTLLLLHAFLLAFVLAEATKFAVQIVGYRRGF